MKRILRLGAPTVGTVMLRVAQLAVLLAFARLTTGDAQQFLVTGFGVLASFAIISDAGGAPFLLSLPADRQSKRTHRRVVILQSALVLIGPLGVVLFALAIAPDGMEAASFVVLAALSLAQAFDTLTRTTKSPWLVHGDDHLFALPDVLNGAAKIGIVGVALVTGDVLIVGCVAIVSFFTFLVAHVRVARTLPERNDDEPMLVRRTLEIGLTGALSGAYSQSPMLFAAWLLPLETAAVFAVLYRFVQAMELVPATASTQLIPRASRFSAVRLWTMFSGTGLLFAGALMLAWPTIGNVLTMGLPISLTLPITLAFVLKCGNYALVAHLLGKNRVRQRLIITITTGLGALALVPSMIWAAGGMGLSLSAPLVEIIFLLTTVVVLRLYRQPLGGRESL